MSTEAAIARLTRQIRATARVGEQVVRVRNCVVDHHVTGGAADGSTAVFIQAGADVIPANYEGATAPADGATVRVEFTDGSPLIRGVVSGPPAL